MTAFLLTLLCGAGASAPVLAMTAFLLTLLCGAGASAPVLAMTDNRVKDYEK